MAEITRREVQAGPGLQRHRCVVPAKPTCTGMKRKKKKSNKLKELESVAGLVMKLWKLGKPGISCCNFHDDALSVLW